MLLNLSVADFEHRGECPVVKLRLYSDTDMLMAFTDEGFKLGPYVD
jgi:hypothetical protein